MNIQDLDTLFGEHAQVKSLQRELARRGTNHVLLSGLYASARSMVLSALPTPLFIVMDNDETARYIYSDLRP